MKRKLDVCYSPDSSTPPRPPAKKHQSSIPSDSPSNPFGLRLNSQLRLPEPSYYSDHLVLRFQLHLQGRNVYRVVSVPQDYTFWHLRKLAQFIFGWKLPSAPTDAGRRKRTQPVEHRFEVLKDVAMCAQAVRVGQVKEARTWARMMACSPARSIKHPGKKGETGWYEEETFTLRHAWSKGPDVTKAISYVSGST